MKIEDSPVYGRPYERFQKYGSKSLTDTELFAILLRSGTKDCNVLQLAEKLLCFYTEEPSFTALYDLGIEQLTSIKGIGVVKAIQILTLLEVSIRIAAEKGRKEEKVKGPEDIAALFMEQLRHQKEEYFYIVLLDAKSKLVGQELISKGSLNASIVHPREVYKRALMRSAFSIIALHNHPSGDPSPSKEDIGITERLKQVGEVMGVPLLDHIILGNNQYVSLKEKGYF